MARTEADLTIFMLVQDLLPKHWAWEDDEKEAIGDCKKMAQVVLNRLQSAGCEVIELHAIIHDKDERQLWNECKKELRTRFSRKHINIVAKLAKETGKTLDTLAEIIGVEKNYIEKPDRGRYSYDNLLAYLIHIKYEEKFQYDFKSVHTLVGKNYQDYYQERYEAWLKGKYIKIHKQTEIDIKEVCARIATGDLTKMDLLSDKRYAVVYTSYRDRILKALCNRQLYLDDKKEAGIPLTEEEQKEIKRN